MIGVEGTYVEVGTPIDLDNCAREPIHIPGSIQPRGVLIVVREPDLVVTQVSANIDTEATISPPLGVAGVTYRPTQFVLAPDAMLLMFSDGLIERRDEDIDAGIERLARDLAGLHGADAQTVWSAVSGEGIDDDATVLALHRPA